MRHRQAEHAARRLERGGVLCDRSPEESSPAWEGCERWTELQSIGMSCKCVTAYDLPGQLSSSLNGG